MSTHGNKTQFGDRKLDFALRPYPIDLSPFLQLPLFDLDAADVPNHMGAMAYNPTTIAQCALAHWNQYLATGAECHLRTFLEQAYWLVEHESRIGNDAGGWPISLPRSDFHGKGLCLSALTQGYGISVLVRAYQLTREEVFLGAARRAICTFERDILDGGVCAPIGDGGLFFEEVAVYPAAHSLSGFIFALFGLYDYVAITSDVQIETLIHRSLETMCGLLKEFDVGFWTRSELLQRRLATPSELALQVRLLEALARYAGCDHYSTVASRWKSYQRQWRNRFRYRLSQSCSFLWSRIQSKLFPKSQASPFLRICVAVGAFPAVDGVSTVLKKIAQVTTDIWQIEFLAQCIGPVRPPEKYVIRRFGTKMTTPRYFPFAWLYFFAGFWKLISLMRRGAGYHVILPQSGTFTGAFSALAARLAGVRVVCFDHGELNLLVSRNSHLNRAERIRDLKTRNLPWVVDLLARQLLALYWPSRYLAARVAARFVDHYLIPGVSGDGLDDTCQELGVYPSRITRFANMIDLDRHIIPDTTSRANRREKNGIAADAIVIAIICRLAPEKGIDIALEAISQALATLSPDRRACVRIIIAGDGPLRKHIEEDICVRGLKQVCLLWGEASTEEVIMLLGLSDIFLYTSRRGAGYPLAILEAMASSCAVIASTEPLANEYMLAEGRGIAVPPGNVEQTAMAIVRLVNDLELCRRMGRLARDYVALYHSPAMFKRTLMRATYWSALDEFLDAGKKLEAAVSERAGEQ